MGCIVRYLLGLEGSASRPLMPIAIAIATVAAVAAAAATAAARAIASVVTTATSAATTTAFTASHSTALIVPAQGWVGVGGCARVRLL